MSDNPKLKKRDGRRVSGQLHERRYLIRVIDETREALSVAHARLDLVVARLRAGSPERKGKGGKVR